MENRVGWSGLPVAMILGAWLPLSATVPAHWSLAADFNARIVFAEGGMLYALRDRQMAVSGDQGMHWVSASPVLPENLNPESIVRSGSRFYAAGRSQGVFRSASGDAGWQAVNAGLPADKDVFTVSVTPAWILAGTNHGVYGLPVEGGEWTSLAAGILDSISIPGICAAGTTLFLATNTGFSYRGAPQGGGYAWLKRGMRYPKAVVSKGKSLYSASIGDISSGRNSVLNRSDDDGLTWTPADSGLPQGGLVILADLACVGNTLFAGHTFLSGSDPALSPIFASEDDGATWMPAGSGLPVGMRFQSFAVAGATLFAAASGGGIWALSVPVAIPSRQRLGAAGPTGKHEARTAPGIIRVQAAIPAPVHPGRYRPTGARLRPPF